MATHTVTLANGINVFGAEPTSKWGSMVWGADNWGQGTITLPLIVYKGLSNSITLTDSLSKIPRKYIENTLEATNEITDINKIDSDGYFYVFKPRTTDAIDRSTPVYTSATASAITYTTVTRTTTTWSS